MKVFLSALAYFLPAVVFAATALAAAENSTEEAPTAEFHGDRRPGILEPPSDVPTGENAHLYDFLTESFGDESVAEAPKSSDGLTDEERYESAPTDEL